jgi:hypothetical protein
MEEKEIDVDESLIIIQQMVNRAKNNISENGFMYIFWGWLVFITAIAFFILMKMGFEWAPIVWMTMPLGGIFSGIWGYTQRKNERVKTYVDSHLAYVWIAFGICLLIVLGMGWQLKEHCYPIVIMLYAVSTFVSGGIIRFKPLIICGALSFPIAVAAFFVNFDVQVLLLALSVLVSYIIPGHWLQLEFKKNGI